MCNNQGVWAHQYLRSKLKRKSVFEQKEFWSVNKKLGGWNNGCLWFVQWGKEKTIVVYLHTIMAHRRVNSL